MKKIEAERVKRKSYCWTMNPVFYEYIRNQAFNRREHLNEYLERLIAQDMRSKTNLHLAEQS